MSSSTNPGIRPVQKFFSYIIAGNKESIAAEENRKLKIEIAQMETEYKTALDEIEAKHKEEMDVVKRIYMDAVNEVVDGYIKAEVCG